MVSVLFASVPVGAEPLKELLPGFLDGNNLMKAAKADVETARQSMKATMGGWYPALDVTAHYGKEDQQKPNETADTSMVSREADFTVTQRLYDFGATSASVRSAELSHEQARAVLTSTRSSLLLRAVTAYANVVRATEALGYATKSEANIKKQTELENALVKRGAGFSTDVLQAKVQLAGAQARLVRAEGALQIAKNTYRGVFLKQTGPTDAMMKPVLPVDQLPAGVEDAVVRALKNNAQLTAANLTSRIAGESIKSARASGFYPTLDAIAELKWKNNVSATANTQREAFGKFELNFPFNLGLTSINTLKAAEQTQSAANYRYADSKNQIEEQTRNAWEQLKTAKSNAELLGNQANIASEFLEFARKERTLGRRSLLDVLSGETALINASSDAASAEIDVTLAVFTLLDAMGELNEAALTR
ncbi:MAG: TolC family protein [Alphaproteobacteria bacterium]